MRTAGVELAQEANSLVASGWRPDAILATDMMNLASFREGLAGRFPTALYMHENQLTYGATIDVAHGRINAESLAASDLTIFNSQYHWSSFGEGVMTLDHPSALAAWRRAIVIPVGIDLPNVSHRDQSVDSPIIVWNHRWETDKRPDLFSEALHQIEDLEWELILLGERDRSDALDTITRRFGERLVHGGFAEPPVYRALLSKATLAVSTAEQEFFGVSIVEAVAAGAFPLVPNRLSYPELLGSPVVEHTLYDGDLAPALRWAIQNPDDTSKATPALSSRMHSYDWSVVAPLMDRALDDLVATT